MNNINWNERFLEVYHKMLDLEMENIRLRKKIESLQKPPKKKVFVVCENEEEFAYYGRLENNINYVYLEHPEQLRGIHNPEVIYIGNWIRRRNIIDLITMIKMTSV